MLALPALLALLVACGARSSSDPASGVHGAPADLDSRHATAAEVDEVDDAMGRQADPSEIAPDSAASAVGTAESCLSWAAPVEKGPLGALDLSEASGLVASRRLPGVLWSHNDSGEEVGRVFALGSDGAHRATVSLSSLQPDDVEDIALGPCAPPAATSDCLYLADTGDNGHKRKTVEIFQVREPDALPAAGGVIEGVGVQVHRLRYPKHPGLQGAAEALAEHPDVEAMVVLADGRVVLFDKRDDGTSAVYRAPLTGDTVAIAEALGTLDLRDGALKQGPSLRTTAADLSGDGRRLLIRTYFRVFEFDVDGVLAAPALEVSAALPALSAAKRSVAHGFDTQGEAIAYDPAGGFWHVSEGVGSSLFFVGCVP